jgi:hypothetical protein
MAETALDRYAALLKRTAVASVLDFTDEEWANLQKLREDTSTKATSTTVATDESWMDAIKDTANVGDLGVLGTNDSASGSDIYQGLV